MAAIDIAPAAGSAHHERWATLTFGATVFTGSFLLFLVQPLIAKQLLPWFGGAATVWAVCVAFFQLGLLLGYTVAHWLARDGLRSQRWSALTLLAVTTLTLPIVASPYWKPDQAAHAARDMVGALAATVGLPYVLIAMTGPLVQGWYARRFGGRSPYGLYALSNAAALLALLSYPLLLEPHLTGRQQAYGWSAGYVLWASLLALSRFCAGPAPAIRIRPRARTEPVIAFSRQLQWLAFAALGSALLLAVTNHLTQDVAAIPLLWTLPLAIYLATYSLAFHGQWLTPARLVRLGLCALVIYALSIAHTVGPAVLRDWSLWLQIVAYCLVLAAACLFCHSQLALTKPPAAQLTRFYLAIALGGAMGSCAIALVAPSLLSVNFDLPGVMVLFAAALAWRMWRLSTAVRWSGVALYFVTLCVTGAVIQQFYEGTVESRRNFYGTLRVYDWQVGPIGMARSLSNGAIVHGMQYQNARYAERPNEYYGRESGIGRALGMLMAQRPALRVGVIGLGTGTIATYGRSGDVYRFYELNPAVIDVAQRDFSFLRTSGARIELRTGDARLSLESEPSQQFDLLAVDAFLSDAVPVHLLTVEALDVYLRHLKPGGLLLFDTSNRYVNLPPVIARLAAARHLYGRVVASTVYDAFDTPSTWVLLSADARALRAAPIAAGARSLPAATQHLWSDDFSDPIEVLR